MVGQRPRGFPFHDGVHVMREQLAAEVTCCRYDSTWGARSSNVVASITRAAGRDASVMVVLRPGWGAWLVAPWIWPICWHCPWVKALVGQQWPEGLRPYDPAATVMTVVDQSTGGAEQSMIPLWVGSVVVIPASDC